MIDGYRIDDLHSETLKPTKLFYPLWWLKQVGYFPDGVNPDTITTPVVTVTPTAAAPVAATPAAGHASTHSNEQEVLPPHLSAVAAAVAPGMFPTSPDAAPSSTTSSWSMVSLFGALLVGVAIGFGGGRWQQNKNNRHEYVSF
jgi:hypothetical protein